MIPLLRRCSRCHGLRGWSDFTTCTTSPTGRRTICKQCTQDRRKARRQTDPLYRDSEIEWQRNWTLRNTADQERLLLLRENRFRLRPAGKQRCVVCMKIKPLDDYHFTRSSDTQGRTFRPRCRECLNAYARKHRARARHTQNA